MTEAAYDYLNQLYPINKIYPEELIYKTGTSNKGRGGFTCDFLIKDTNEIFEVKQRTTTSSNKTLYGQIFVYQSQGYKVNVILPNDVLVTDSMRHILSKNKRRMVCSAPCNSGTSMPSTSILMMSTSEN